MDLPDKVNGKVPRWALEKYEGAETDFTDWLYSLVYWHMYEQAGDFGEPEKIAADARVRQEQLIRTMDISSTVERSLAWQWMHASKTAWYRYLPAEYETVEELLAFIMDGVTERNADGNMTSLWSDIRFYVEDFVPWAKIQGVDATKLMKLPELWDAARSAVPYLRRILKDDSVTGEQRVKQATEVLDKLATAGSVREFRQTMADGNFQKHELEQIIGSRYVMHDHTRIVLVAPTEAHVKVIERRLDRLVSEWKDGDAMDYQHDSAEMIHKRVS